MSLLLCAQRLAPWSPSSAAALPLTQRAAACQHHSWRDGTDLLGPPLCPCKTNLQTHREQLALQVFELAVSTVTAEVPEKKKKAQSHRTVWVGRNITAPPPPSVPTPRHGLSAPTSSEPSTPCNPALSASSVGAPAALCAAVPAPQRSLREEFLPTASPASPL